MGSFDLTRTDIKHRRAPGGDQKKSAAQSGNRSSAHIKQSRLDFSTVASHAAGNWQTILVQSGVRGEYLSRKHAACPGCGGRDRFRFDDKDGRGTFVCGGGGDPLAGDGFRLLEHAHGWTASEALRFVAGVLGLDRGYTPPARALPAPTTNKALEDYTESVRRVWSNAKPLTGDCTASRYLANRGLALTSYPPTLRCHPALPYWNDGSVIYTSAALVGIAQSADGKCAGIQRIWLDDNNHKAIIEHDGTAMPNKRMLSRWQGAIAGAAVRLGEPVGGRLLVCEGIETGLACMELFGLPAWAALSTSGVKSLLLPAGIHEVVIAADNDSNQAGELAAKALADRLTAAGVLVRIALPPDPGTDWLDVLAAGKEARHAA